ncbi:MAG TPA: hypothetical protein VG253_25565 [Streptosporangiaceae bacterium]|nr:hypothetical protein [Streptosporangiaceae bacterium]
MSRTVTVVAVCSGRSGWPATNKPRRRHSSANAFSLASASAKPGSSGSGRSQL